MRAKVYLETMGCQMNVADSERAATRLRAAGYDLTDSEASADAVIFNTCSVRARAEQKVYNRIGEVRKGRAGGQLPIIGVMGCVAQLEGEAIFDQSPLVSMVVGTRATDRLPQMLTAAFQEKRQKLIDLGEREIGSSWDVSADERHSPYTAFVPIIEGCNKFCSYCIVPYSRGRERSRPAAEIVAEVQDLRAKGYKEVHLIGQNVNSYRPQNDPLLKSYEGFTPFSQLLRAVAATRIERVKFTTSFPRDFHQDVVAAIDEHENLCNWIHLPVQSGSDRILRAMRRGHKALDYLKRVEYIKRSPNKYALTSDIIVGFPGETVEDFQATLKLVQTCQYDGLYLFKYSPRHGTPAFNLDDDVQREEKTARFLELQEVQRGIQSHLYQSYIGRKVNVLVEGTSAKSKNYMTGHTDCHKVVNFPGEAELLGQVLPVVITEAKANSLQGEVLR